MIYLARPGTRLLTPDDTVSIVDSVARSELPADATPVADGTAELPLGVGDVAYVDAGLETVTRVVVEGEPGTPPPGPKGLVQLRRPR